LVKDTILRNEELIEFKEQIDELISDDSDRYYIALLTLSQFHWDESYSTFLPDAIPDSDEDLRVGMRECLSYFGWCIGL